MQARLFRLGLVAAEHLSHQRMFVDLALRPRGETLAALGKIEPLLGQPLQSALVEGRCGFVGEVDDFGGGHTVVLFLTH